MSDEARSAATTAFQWLIERGQPEGEQQAVWLENSVAHPASHKRWTTDANEAAMFPTKETAEAYIAERGLEARAVEHGFMHEPTREERLEQALDTISRMTRIADPEVHEIAKEALRRV